LVVETVHQVKECQKKTTWQRSQCGDDGKIVYLIATKNGLNRLPCDHAHLDELQAYYD
jgi:hypothetical protein